MSATKVLVKRNAVVLEHDWQPLRARSDSPSIDKWELKDSQPTGLIILLIVCGGGGTSQRYWKLYSFHSSEVECQRVLS